MYCNVESMKKGGWIPCQKFNIYYHEICVAAKGKNTSLAVDASDQNCTSKVTIIVPTY